MSVKINPQEYKLGIGLEVVSLAVYGIACLVERHNNTFSRNLIKKEGEVILEETTTSVFSTIELPKVERRITVQWEQDGDTFTKRFNDQYEQYSVGDSFPLWVSEYDLGYGIEYRDRHKSTVLKATSGILGVLGVATSLLSYYNKK